MTTLKIPIRYLAMHNTSQGDVVEANIRYRETVWEIDPREAAFILIDFWDTHILRSHLERYRKITEQVIKPLLPAARSAGITVVHAPGFTIAKRYPQWEAYGGFPQTHRRLRPVRETVRHTRSARSGEGALPQADDP